MGSLKRKNASLGASPASNKRPSREDASGAAVPNGYTGRRAAGSAQSLVLPFSSSAAFAAASMPAATPVLEPLCNGVSAAAKTSEDPHLSTSSSSLLDTKSALLNNLMISDKEPSNSQDQEADTVVVLPESLHANNLGPLTPNHAGWFSWNSIHAVERRGLPEFFNTKSKLKTPALYMQYRNLLMRKYLENPDKVFTLADVVIDQKGGHLEAVKRIFEFLNHWGLLNSRALQHAEAEKPSKSRASVIEDTSGQPQWSLTSSLYQFDNPIAFHSSRSLTRLQRTVPPAVMTETTAADLQGGEQGLSVEYHCNSCSADCSKKRFHCQKQADFDLCPECYNGGKFSIGITSTDFILMEAVTDANSSDGWSDQETLLLLEALEMFGDNFSEIAEHVGTKTKAQCILHFIRLPIEDPFLEAVDANNNTTNAQTAADSIANAKSCQGEDQEENPKVLVHDPAQQEDSISVSGNAHHVDLPANDEKSSSAMNAIIAAAEAAGLFASDKQLALSECSNPVMTLVAFLAALVEPDAVSTSAQAALKVLADHASALQLADENSFHLELETPSTDATSASDINKESEEAVQLRSQSDPQDTPDVGGDRTERDDKGNANLDAEGLTKGSSLVSVKNAATTALAAAAVKAKFLADQEEWEILRLAAFVVDSQTKKIETKLKLFRELDAALEKEHNLLERSRQRLFVERSQIAATRAVQSSASGPHYTNVNAVIPGGPRPHHPMSRLPAGFVAVPPVPTGPRPSGPNDYIRGPPPPMLPQGMSMAPMRPVYYNNTQF
ncbi:hypothetical protein GOP47_0014600 [Adiantum capillus-veneris]|uniref:SWI/SNF complex subunit SWI3D n=1 Tax=Adiantum capillus-veneris TaxID=13818 RepID=A0A9D4UMM1_ADICA|nr:hypothetical protein GOP47_0014600 [Adiantum capillus-veneris]